MQGRRALVTGVMRAMWRAGDVELREGRLLKTLWLTAQRRSLAFAQDWTFADLLEWSAVEYRTRTFLEYGTDSWTFEEMNQRANRVARQLRAAGVGPNTGVALMMSNHPRFLDSFFAVQKLGAYAVPVNVALMGDGLQYVIDHSDSSVVLCDCDAAPKVQAVVGQLPKVKHIWVNTAEAPDGFEAPEGMRPFDELEVAGDDDSENPGHRPESDDPSMLLYTSGTTGLPKAVVSTYSNQRTKLLGMAANLILNKEDKVYTCLPLFHANALLLSVMQALWVGIPLRLSKRFSASRFWKELSECGATIFNTVGGMIPIMLKTAETPYEKQHKVRLVVSAACPKDAWETFETRFGVTLWEFYGAVDGAGVTIANTGTAPVGSLGKLPKNTNWRLVRDDGADAAPGEPGELWVDVGNRKESTVPYWKNDKASNDKVVDGWLHTGDLMQKDDKGFLYFVGRNTDSMRHGGENVSAYEVEKVVDAHPSILESAAFGVPSPMSEEDIMVSVVLVEGETLDPVALRAFLAERLPKYAVPSHLDVLESLPKTGTHRVIKATLKERGVNDKTISLAP